MMDSKGESLSIQIGQYSNFVGTHLWNINEEVVRSGYDANPRYSRYYHESNGGKRSPRCLMLDLNENIGSLYSPDLDSLDNYSDMWSGNTQRSIHSNFGQKSGSVANTPKDLVGSNNWSDMIKFNLHCKSVCELPKWISKDDFDSYFKGNVGGPLAAGISRDYIEDVTEKIRYFAEACNNLSVISLYADFHDGSGGLTGSLLEAIREDFGRSVCIPVWAFTESSRYWGTRSILPDDLSIKNAMIDLNLPLCYANITEHTNILIPMDLSTIFSRFLPQSRSSINYSVRNNALKLSSSVAATAIAVTAPLGGSDLTASDSVHASIDMIQAATNKGAFPICSIEAYIPPLYCLSQESTSSASSFESDVLCSFDTFPGLGKPSTHPATVKLAHTDVAHTSTNKSGSNNGVVATLNPFSLSFSSCCNGPLAGRAAHAYSRPFTNVIRVRGRTNRDMSSLLYEKCLGSSYRITTCSQDDVPLPLHLHQWYSSLTDPELEHHQEHQDYQKQQQHRQQEQQEAREDGETVFRSHGFSGFSTNAEGHGEDCNVGEQCAERGADSFSHSVAAVGAGVGVGLHLEQVVACWEGRSAACTNQLQKSGLEMEDCDELMETLKELASRYTC